MEHFNTHYVSPKLEVRNNSQKGSYGIYSTTYIPQGELLICWGGVVMTSEQLQKVTLEQREHSIQIETNLYQVPLYGIEAGDYVNHSCEPNAGLSDSITLIAIRDIQKDDEICFDYAMSDSSSYDEFNCGCGTSACRKIISGNDWQLPYLQKKYDGYFSPYLSRKISKLHLESFLDAV